MLRRLLTRLSFHALRLAAGGAEAWQGREDSRGRQRAQERAGGGSEVSQKRDKENIVSEERKKENK